ncbi:adhesion G-protein coupled receptor G2-like [Arapaima gigas]
MPWWETVFSGTREEARAARRTMRFPGQGLKTKGYSRLSKVLLCLSMSLFLYHEATATEAASLGGMKAVFLHDCSEHWTLREQGTLAMLAHVTLCVDVRVLLPGMWTAFSYGSPQSQQSELSLQGDGHALSVWLGGRRYRFPGHLTLKKWHHVCVTLDTSRSLLTLWVDSVPYRQSIGTAATPTSLNGELTLGCRTPVENMAKVELYLFRVWDDILHRDSCECGNVVDWNSLQWNLQTVVKDTTLPCDECFSLVISVCQSVLADEELTLHVLPASNGISHPTAQSLTPPSRASTASAPSPLSTSISTTPLPRASTSTAPTPSAETLTPPPTSASAPPTSSTSTTPPPPLPDTTSLHPSATTLTSTPPPVEGTFTTTPPVTSTTIFSTVSTMLLTDSISAQLTTVFTRQPPTSPKSTLPASNTTSLSSFTNTTSPNTTFSASNTTPLPAFTNTTSPNTFSASNTTPLPAFTNTTSPNTTFSASNTTSLPAFTNTTSPNTTFSASNTTPLPAFTNTTSPNTTFSASNTTPLPAFTNTTSPNTTASTTPPPTLSNTLFPAMSTATTPATSKRRNEMHRHYAYTTYRWLPVSSAHLRHFISDSSSEGPTSVSTTNSTNNTGRLTWPVSSSSLMLRFRIIIRGPSRKELAQQVSKCVCVCVSACIHMCDVAFYWMTLQVKAGQVNTNESEVAVELSRLFDVYVCVETGSSILTATPTAAPTDTAVTTGSADLALLTLSLNQSTTSGSSDTFPSPFSLSRSLGSMTNCTVLLQLSPLVSTCWLVQQLQKSAGNIQASLLGSVETLAQGHCPAVPSAPPGGDIVICDAPAVVSGQCQNSEAVNVTCHSYAKTVYVPLVTDELGNTLCPSPSSEYQPKGTGPPALPKAPGLFRISLLFFNAKSKQHWTMNNCSCRRRKDRKECLVARRRQKKASGTHIAHKVPLNVPSRPNVYQVHLRLSQRVTVCQVWNEVSVLFPSKGPARLSGPVIAMAIYSLQSGPTADLLTLNFTMEYLTVNSSQVCQLQDQLKNILICDPQKNTYVLLNESCTDSTFVGPKPTASPAPATSNTTLWVNTTSKAANSTANFTAVTYSGSTLWANATSSTPVTTGTVASTTASATLSPVEKEAEGLLNMTSDVSALNSSQVEQLVMQLQELLSGPNVSLRLGTTAITITSNLLNASASVLAASSTRLIEVVDTVGLKLVLPQDTETILSTSLALAIQKVNGTNFQQTSFSILDPSNVQVSSGAKLGRTVRSVLPQASITLPASLTSNLPLAEQLQASRVQFNFYQKSSLFVDPALGNRSLNSGILGSSVSNVSISGLKAKVVFTLRNNKQIPANYVASCVFWNFSENGGLGGWSSEGCSVQNSTNEETICSCNHLTSFAVLLDISRQNNLDPRQVEILTYITYIGCGISAIFLSVTLLTYLAFEKLRKDIPSKILIQLCLALLLLNLVFLLDSWLALYPKAVGLCISTAFFLHYFLLASFTWMGLEAFHMYLALVKVFNTYVSRYMLKFGLIGWGTSFPLIVVIIVIAISKDNYGLMSYGRFPNGSTDDFCWIKSDVAFYVAVVAYFCAIFLLNTAMFVVVLGQLCRIKRQNPHNTQHRSMWQDMRSVAGLTVLLGLTWGFAFFAWGPVNLAFMYLFSIFNSLQGFFIFVFHCAVKDVVRRQWRAYLCCGKLRLPENSDWSQTATQKATRNRSRVMATSSRSSNSTESNNSSSSTALFLPSRRTEPVNGIGGPLEDRTITTLEQRSEDVVLNEIDSRHRRPRER